LETLWAHFPASLKLLESKEKTEKETYWLNPVKDPDYKKTVGNFSVTILQKGSMDKVATRILCY
jgi:hypothetical protein